MDFLKEIVKEIGDDFTQLIYQILMKLKNMWTQVRNIFNGELYQAVYLAGVSNNKITIRW